MALIVGRPFFFALDELTDVVLTSPSANQVLYFNGTEWVNGSITTAMLPTIDHGSLSGLADDDHTQYIIKSGATFTRNTITSDSTADGALKLVQGTGGLVVFASLFQCVDGSANTLFSVITADSAYAGRISVPYLPLALDNNNEARFQELSANGSNYVAIKSPSSMSANFTHTLAQVTGTSVVASTTSTTLRHAYFSNGTAGGAECRAITSADLPAGTGTVTSVGLSVPGIFSVAGSPVTTSGTITIALANQSANLVFAGPSAGLAAAPTFRTLTSLDLPSTVVYTNTNQTISGTKTFSAAPILNNSVQIYAKYTTGNNGEFFTVWSDNVTYLGNYSDTLAGLGGVTMQVRYGRGNGSGNAIIIDGAAQTLEEPLARTQVAPSSSAVPLKVKAAASQSADLTQWLNSSSTVLSCVDAAGRLGVLSTDPDANGAQVARFVAPSGAGAQAIEIDCTQGTGAIAPFIDYRGDSASDASTNISTRTTDWTLAGMVRVEINGTQYWMPYYLDAAVGGGIDE